MISRGVSKIPLNSRAIASSFLERVKDALEDAAKEAYGYYAMHKDFFGMPLHLEQLATFVNVADLGSFTAAADKEGLTQPAVSLQVKGLEQRLGVRLIERVGRRAQPTAAGLDLLVHAKRLLQASAATE
jgi:hypothetical protein